MAFKIGVHHSGPTNSTNFTNCCHVAILDTQEKCPKCHGQVVPASVRWEYAFGNTRRSILRNSNLKRKALGLPQNAECMNKIEELKRSIRQPNNGFLSIEEATGKPVFADNISLVEWIDARFVPPDRTNVLVYGGIAQFHKDTGVWYTQMEYPERPILWRVTHWAYIPKPSQALIEDANFAAERTKL